MLPIMKKMFRNDNADSAMTHLIFFIAAVVVAISVVAVLTSNVQSLTGSTAVSSKIMAEQLRTDITVISDPEMIPYDSVSYTFYVKNTGQTELATGFINIFIDGELIAPANVNMSLPAGEVVWRTGDVLEIDVSISELSEGDHRFLIAAENGKTDAINFRTS